MTSSRSSIFPFLVASLVVLSGGAAGPSNSQELTLGSFEVGDTGPGGGIIFFVSDDPFPCGAEMRDTCTYLEVAPDGWSGGDKDPLARWSGTVDRKVGTQISLGFGYQNTLAAVAQDPTPGTAITLADSYANNGKTDWFLPSQNELNELCKYAHQQTTGDITVMCDDSGSLRSGFEIVCYWSSSDDYVEQLAAADPELATALGITGHGHAESDSLNRPATHAWAQHYNDGHPGNRYKTNAYKVRPVRAF